MAKREKLGAKDRLIRSARTRISNRLKKLKRARHEYDLAAKEIKRDIAEQKELLKALGATP